MAKLLYKTRGMAFPQGKPKVYFCCHPKEATRFLEIVSEELLQKQDCAVWYLENPHTARDDALLDDLKTMQLFVMPVTRTLLSTANPAIDTEFAFAIKHHIPVLPLMQEDGLDELFNRRCGDLQYLSRFVSDPTAIPYDEKLSAYLSTMLIGDELAEKIRAAFDAYVFLSYRKKDRRYAQELMQLIHKHEFARDIAIWYDEFLTPGENFTDAIRKALHNSKLFVLAVTPRLTEPDNYVMTIEYPLAREEGKPVLPAEMCPTDRTALEDAFEAIPACTDAHDGTALSEALLTALRSVACRENDTPAHDFFIGLAYLSGVDVEVDHKRAVALITSAAERGLTEAFDKLVEMYQNGIGVERNYRTAIDWLAKKAAFIEMQYRQKPSEETADTLIWCYFACGDALKDVAELESAKTYYQKATDLALGFLNKQKRGMFRIFLKKRNTTTMQYYLSRCYDYLGYIARAQGNLESAEAYHQKELDILLALYEKSATTQIRQALSTCFNRLGNVAEEKGDLDGAKAYHQKDLSFLLALDKEADTPHVRHNLSVSYEALGDIAEAQGDLDGAEAYFQKSFEISLALAEETGTIWARRGLICSYNHLCSITYAKGDLSRTEVYCQKMMELALAIAQETETVQARHDLALSYNSLLTIARDKGDLDHAQMYCQKSMKLALALVKETGTIAARRLLTTCYDRFGELAQEKDDLNTAKVYYQKEMELTLALAEETGTVDARRNLSVSYHKLGIVARDQGDIKNARDYWQKASALRLAIFEETETAESLDDLATSHYYLATISRKEDKTTHLREALRLFTLLCEQCPQIPLYHERRDFVQENLDDL